MSDMDENVDLNASNNTSNDSSHKTDDVAESSEVKEDQELDDENSDDGCVDSEDNEEETKSGPEEADVNDDRSQTPLQDEVESNQSERLEPPHENAGSPDTNGFENSPVGMEKIDSPSHENGIKEEKHHETLASCTFKGSDLNDDHGELDYEEDVDDNKPLNKHIDDDENSDNGEFDSTSNKQGKDLEEDKEFHSSDGELLDDEDCEEGEIKEAGARRQFQRPLCRFFTRGSCTWGANCRFLHPGINDKGNYSMLQQPAYMQSASVPMRAAHFSNVHERLGSRAAIPEPLTVEGLPLTSSSSAPTGAHESAWERGLRHAKEMRNKSKAGDDQKDTSPVSSPSPVNHSRPPQLAPPPPRDPFYDRPHPPMMPGMPGLHHGMHMGQPPPHHPHHPMDAWPYRPPLHHHGAGAGGGDFDAMRWPRPPHMHQSHEFMHQSFPMQYDYRMQGGREQRFSPSQRMKGRFERFGRPAAASVAVNRGKPEEWKDPWSRTKSTKKASSSRSGSRKRSHTSYSSFTSSSYSSRSRSGSSYSSSRSSSRSSSSRSRSRGKSPIARTNKKAAAVSKLPRKPSEAAKSKTNPKVIPPSLADTDFSPPHKALPTRHKVPPNLPQALPTKPAAAPVVFVAPPPPVVTPISLAAAAAAAPVKEAPTPPVPTPVVMKAPMQITLPSKPTKSLSKTSQLHKSVAEAFKDADDDDDERGRKKPRLSKFSPEESLYEAGKMGGTAVMAGGVAFKSGVVHGNVGYPVPVKAPHDASKSVSELKRKKLPDKFSRSKESSDSRSSYSSSSSGSSASSSSKHSKRYSHLASPISSDSSASPSKRKAKMDRLRLVKASQEYTGYPRPGLVSPPGGMLPERNGMREAPFRGARGGEQMPVRREYRQERSYEEVHRGPPRRPEYHRPPGDYRGSEALFHDEMPSRGEGGRKHGDMPRPERPDYPREARDYRSKEEDSRAEMYRYGDERQSRGARRGAYGAVKRGSRGRYQRAEAEYDNRGKRDSPPAEARRPPHDFPPSSRPPHDARYNQTNHQHRRPSREPVSFRKRPGSPAAAGKESFKAPPEEGGRPGRGAAAGVGPAHKPAVRHDRREELLMQLKAVEDAIAKKKNKNF